MLAVTAAHKFNLCLLIADFDDDDLNDDPDEPDFLPPRAMGPILPPLGPRPKRSLSGIRSVPLGASSQSAAVAANQASSKYSASDLGNLLARYRKS